jgi:hypothetical protein
MRVFKEACLVTGMLDGKMQAVHTEPGEEGKWHGKSGTS